LTGIRKTATGWLGIDISANFPDGAKCGTASTVGLCLRKP